MKISLPLFMLGLISLEACNPKPYIIRIKPGITLNTPVISNALAEAELYIKDHPKKPVEILLAPGNYYENETIEIGRKYF